MGDPIIFCRCHDGTDFVAQTCEFNQFSSEASACSNVGSDTGCPDLQSLGGTDSGKCIVAGGDGMIYVPQRCPGLFILKRMSVSFISDSF